MANSKDIFLQDTKFGRSRKNSNTYIDAKSNKESEINKPGNKRQKQEHYIILDDEIADIQKIANQLYGQKVLTRVTRCSPRFNPCANKVSYFNQTTYTNKPKALRLKSPPRRLSPQTIVFNLRE